MNRYTLALAVVVLGAAGTVLAVGGTAVPYGDRCYNQQCVANTLTTRSAAGVNTDSISVAKTVDAGVVIASLVSAKAVDAGVVITPLVSAANVDAGVVSAALVSAAVVDAGVGYVTTAWVDQFSARSVDAGIVITPLVSAAVVDAGTIVLASGGTLYLDGVGGSRWLSFFSGLTQVNGSVNFSNGSYSFNGATTVSGAATIGTSGSSISLSWRGTFTIPTTSIGASACIDSTVTATGMAANAECVLGLPATLEAGLNAACFFKAANQATLRLCNDTLIAIIPAGSQTASLRYFNP